MHEKRDEESGGGGRQSGSRNRKVGVRWGGEERKFRGKGWKGRREGKEEGKVETDREG